MSAAASYHSLHHNGECSSETASAIVETAFETRLQELRSLLIELRSADVIPSPQANRTFHEAVTLLSQNADMIRWKMRVAKHCSRSVRDVIWRNVRNSIADLEKSTDMLEQQVREFAPLPAAAARPFSSNGETLPFYPASRTH
jgi:hypothetical protein